MHPRGKHHLSPFKGLLSWAACLQDHHLTIWGSRLVIWANRLLLGGLSEVLPIWSRRRGRILLSMPRGRSLRNHQRRKIIAPRTQLPDAVVTGLSLASNDIVCLAFRRDFIRHDQERINGGANNAQEQERSHGQVSNPDPRHYVGLHLLDFNRESSS